MKGEIAQVRQFDKFKMARCHNCGKIRIMKYYGWDKDIANYAIDCYRQDMSNLAKVEFSVINKVLSERIKKSQVYFCCRDCAVVGAL